MFGGHIFPRGLEIPYGDPANWVGWFDFTTSQGYTGDVSGDITETNGAKVVNLIDGESVAPLTASAGTLYNGLNGLNGLRQDSNTTEFEIKLGDYGPWDVGDYLMINFVAQLLGEAVNANTRLYMGDRIAGNYHGQGVLIGAENGSNHIYRERASNPNWVATYNYGNPVGNYPLNFHVLSVYRGNTQAYVTNNDGTSATDNSGSGSKSQTWDKIGFVLEDDTDVVLYEAHYLKASSSDPATEAQFKAYVNDKYGFSL